MRTTSAVVLFAVTLTGSAHAEDRELPLEDRGVVLDPYTSNSSLTTGPITGFRRLYVDPSTLIASLVPTTAATGGKAHLAIANPTSAWADIEIGGQKVGRLGPYANATLHGVSPGTYEVSFTLPNGRQITSNVDTVTSN